MIEASELEIEDQEGRGLLEVRGEVAVDAGVEGDVDVEVLGGGCLVEFAGIEDLEKGGRRSVGWVVAQVSEELGSGSVVLCTDFGY